MSKVKGARFFRDSGFSTFVFARLTCRSSRFAIDAGRHRFDFSVRWQAHACIPVGSFRLML